VHAGRGPADQHYKRRVINVICVTMPFWAIFLLKYELTVFSRWIFACDAKTRWQIFDSDA
jgi:hypothetical protein